MSETTGISWCHSTFNPWIGCTKVSAGCANCYAEALMDKRWGRAKWGDAGTRVRTSQKNWDDVLAWDRKAAKEGVRRRVFCASLADVFEDREELTPWRAELFALIERTPNLDWMLLTKRPENVMGMVPESWRKAFPSNVWMGASVENQKAADERVPELLKIPARVRFLSCEPLLGDIALLSLISCQFCDGRGWVGGGFDMETGEGDPGEHCPENCQGHAMIDLIIVGGESGKNARPMHPAWARSIRDQCKAAGVAFFFKQWGEFCPPEHIEYAPDPTTGKNLYLRIAVPDSCRHKWADGTWSYRVGTKAAGHLLDGVEHHEMPNDTPKGASE